MYACNNILLAHCYWGQHEQREREERKAAAICCMIDQFLPANKSCTEASTSAEQESCSSTKVTTSDANQQISSTEPLCEGGNEEHIGVTEKIEVTESPDDLNSEGLVRQQYKICQKILG